jgi:O-antigen ligase
LLWLALPEELQNRFHTIIDPSYGPEVARDSAESRTQGLLDGLNLWSQHPVTGVGPGAFALTRESGLQAHNLYGQVLGELGTFGSLSFIFALWAFLANTIEISGLYKKHPAFPKDFIYQLSTAVGMAVVLLLVMGYSGHSLYRYTWMWFGAFQAIALHLARRRESLDWEMPGGPSSQPTLPDEGALS